MQRNSGRALLTFLALVCVCAVLQPRVARAEIPAEAKKGLTFTLVKDMSEVLEAAMEMD